MNGTICGDSLQAMGIARWDTIYPVEQFFFFRMEHSSADDVISWMGCFSPATITKHSELVFYLFSFDMWFGCASLYVLSHSFRSDGDIGAAIYCPPIPLVFSLSLIRLFCKI